MKYLKYILFIIACCFISELQAATFRPTNLTCEQLTNPLGIEVRQPLLSWMIESSESGMRQSAYEIIVSDSNASIESNKGNIWNTGKITSNETVFIRYEGAALKPFTRYFWKVRVYNQTGVASEWSQAAWFETAMLDAFDWKAQWIGDGRPQFTRDEDFY